MPGILLLVLWHLSSAYNLIEYPQFDSDHDDGQHKLASMEKSFVDPREIDAKKYSHKRRVNHQQDN